MRSKIALVEIRITMIVDITTLRGHPSRDLDVTPRRIEKDALSPYSMRLLHLVLERAEARSIECTGTVIVIEFRVSNYKLSTFIGYRPSNALSSLKDRSPKTEFRDPGKDRNW